MLPKPEGKFPALFDQFGRAVNRDLRQFGAALAGAVQEEDERPFPVGLRVIVLGQIQQVIQRGSFGERDDELLPLLFQIDRGFLGVQGSRQDGQHREDGQHLNRLDSAKEPLDHARGVEQCDGSREELSCRFVERCVPPHPGPLPWGEGGTNLALGRVRARRSYPALADTAPSPQGRGLG